MATINLGKMGIVNKGDWASGTYKKLEIVRHSGKAYICDAESTTNEPPHTDWFMMVQDGTGTMNNVVDDNTPQLGGDLDTNNKTINTSSYRQIADATLGTGTHTFDYANGDYQKLTVTGDITLGTSNFVVGKVCTFIIELVDAGDHTITLPATWKFANATPPTFSSGGVDKLLLEKDDDDVYSLYILGQAMGTVA